MIRTEVDNDDEDDDVMDWEDAEEVGEVLDILVVLLEVCCVPVLNVPGMFVAGSPRHEHTEVS